VQFRYIFNHINYNWTSLVETAREIMEQQGEEGPLLPRHYQAAYTTLKMSTIGDSDGQLGNGDIKRRLLHGAPHSGVAGSTVI
jgi:hypothetical protein